MPRPRLVLTACLAALALGCQGTPGTSPRPGARPRATAAPPSPGALAAATRAVPQVGTAASLVGKAKLISDRGAGVISNNGGGYRIAQAPAQAPAQASKLAEALLAEAAVEVLDASGAVLTDEKGKPLSAKTGADGAYRLSAVLPAEALVLRIKLWSGGELRALLAKDAPRTNATADLDTAASLGAAFVLDAYVKGRREVLDRLPAAEGAALRAAVAAALAGLDRAPDYALAAQVDEAARLRDADPGVKGALARIEAILLAGQARLGDGLLATEVALVTPMALAPDGEGGLLIGERVSGRIQRVRADGTMELLVDADAARFKFQFANINAILRAPDGSLYVSEPEGNRVRKMAPDGTLTTIAGNGVKRVDDAFTPGPATALPLRSRSLALRVDGTLLVGETIPRGDFHGRLLLVAPDGTVTREATPDDAQWCAEVLVAPDGTEWWLGAADGNEAEGVLAWRKPGQPWTKVATDLRTLEFSGMAPAPAGGVYVAESDLNRIVRITADGARTPVAGTGEPGADGEGGPATAARLNKPTGLCAAPDGSLFFAEEGNGLVRKIAPDGTLSRYAGASGLIRVGDALRLAVAGPSGLAIDPAGALLIAESAGHTIKKLAGADLTTFAGGLGGFAGDGGPAQAARFDSPKGIAFDATGGLLVADSSNHRLRRVRADGVVETLAGRADPGDPPTYPAYEARPATGVFIEAIAGLAAGPDGSVYGSSDVDHNIWRRSPDGQLRLIAGHAFTAPGDPIGDGADGPAAGQLLSYPFDMAFRPGASPPELFFADLGNCRIRKIVDPAGPAPRLEVVAGAGTAASLLKLAENGETGAPGPAREATLLMPSAICFDARGDMYVAEVGTSAAAARALPIPGIETMPRVGARIRKIRLSEPGAPAVVVAGPGGRVLTTGGQDGLSFVGGLAIDREGRLVVADTGANQVKLIPAEALN